MKLVHCLLGFLIFFLVAAGIFVLYGIVGWDVAWAGLVLFLYEEYLVSIGGAVASFLILMLFKLTQSRPKRDAEFISYASKGGRVSLSVKAVKDFIQKIGEEFAAILAMYPSLRVRSGGGVEIDLDVRVQAGTHIPELCRLLQERVKESARDSLGLADIRSVKVNVREIVGSINPTDSIGTSTDIGVST